MPSLMSGNDEKYSFFFENNQKIIKKNEKKGGLAKK